MKQKFTILLMMIVLFTYIIIAGNEMIIAQKERQPEVFRKSVEGNLSYAAWYYFDLKPHDKGRYFQGDPDAPLAMVIYLDPKAEASKKYVEEVYPYLKQNYVDTGKLRLSGSIMVNNDELTNRNERFLYSQGVFCIGKLTSRYFDAYNDIIGLSEQEIRPLAEKYGISRNDFEGCMKDMEFDAIKEDAAITGEMSYLGQRIYIGFPEAYDTVFDGIPDNRTLIKALRNHQVVVGD